MACEDITFSKQAEEALRKSEKRFRELFNSVSDLVYTQDFDGRLLSLNPAFCKTLGYVEEELLGRSVSDFMKPEFAKAFQSEYLDKIKMEGYHEGTSAYFTKYGNEIYLEYRSSIVYPEEGEPYITGIGRDVTVRLLSEKEKQKLQVQLNQAQKMESIGILAGGIAHNFNNLLMNIMGLTGLILAHTKPGDPMQGDLNLIEQEVVKGSALTRQLLSLGQGSKFLPKPLDLNNLLEKAATLFCRTRSGINIIRTLAPGLPAVEVDQSQMEQVMLNLFVNGCQAMSRQGEMILSSREVTLSEAFCQSYKRPPGCYVHISLTDRGKGMDETTLARIFEPFFTTKDVGQGTGLGLATVYAIIKNHRGIIRVDSQPGQGTTFHIFLPVSAKTALGETARDDACIPGAGTILLVDDEDSVRMVAKRMLEQLGYQVLLAADGAEALAIYRREGHRFHLVILDMLMPGMGGAETYRQLKEMDPEVRVLLSSGYSLDGEAQQVMAAGARGFIQKPYRLTVLSHHVAKTIGESEKRLQATPAP